MSFRPVLALALGWLILSPAATLAAESATWLISTDLECRWSVDGEAKGVLKVGDRARVTFAIGEHLIEATPTGGGPGWEQIIKVTAAETKMFTIPLAGSKQQADTKKTGYWVDPETRLMWASQDNGFDVDWNQAVAYCRDLRIAGYSGWALPHLSELQGLRDAAAQRPKGGIKANAEWSWSDTHKEPGEAWLFDFYTGDPDRGHFDFNGYTRALCVRRSGE
jgi:hypothetical protein